MLGQQGFHWLDTSMELRTHDNYYPWASFPESSSSSGALTGKRNIKPLTTSWEADAQLGVAMPDSVKLLPPPTLSFKNDALGSVQSARQVQKVSVDQTTSRASRDAGSQGPKQIQAAVVTSGESVSQQPFPNCATTSLQPHQGVWRRSSEALHIGKDYSEVEDTYPPTSDVMDRQSQKLATLDESHEESVWDGNCDDDILLWFQRDKHNLILDSIWPWVPHIVITPAEDAWDDGLTLSHNRVDPQWYRNLMVPSYGDMNCRASLPPYIQSHPSTAGVFNDRECLSRIPKAVFSISKFHHFIEQSSTQRIIFYYVVIALQKHQYKASAFLASNLASSFRSRYDSPDFLQSLEKPFKWSDPADPILANSMYHLGTLIIDSTYPLIAPHIVINAPPPQSPWIAWNNRTNDPQDCGYGNLLVVPARLVSFDNRYDINDDESCCPPSPSTYSSSADLSGNSSPPDTPLSESALLDNNEAYIIEETSPSGSAGLYECFHVDDERIYAAAISRPSCSIFDGFDDGDEDDLPPFDDWYQTVLSRTQLTVV